MPAKKTVSDELANLERKTVVLKKIFLDPNNPRLYHPGKQKVPENRIIEKTVQESCSDQLKARGLDDLRESIKSLGFVPVDRIVVRPLKGSRKDEYVVVEGNRRIAALNILIKAHDDGDFTLGEPILKTMKKFEVLVYKGKKTDIAWVVQGFRHIPGINKWERYPKAKHLVDLYKKSGKSTTDIASLLGMQVREVNRLIRAYYGFEQAKKDPDYGPLLEQEQIGHFDEIILAVPAVRNWMEWDEKKMRFLNKNNLKKYLSWIVAPKNDKRHIEIIPLVRRTIKDLVDPENRKILDRFDNGELTIDDCRSMLDMEEAAPLPIDIEDIVNELARAKSIISQLPVPYLQLGKTEDKINEKEDIKEVLESIILMAEQQIKNLGE